MPSRGLQVGSNLSVLLTFRAFLGYLLSMIHMRASGALSVGDLHHSDVLGRYVINAACKWKVQRDKVLYAAVSATIIRIHKHYLREKETNSIWRRFIKKKHMLRCVIVAVSATEKATRQPRRAKQ
ncbi:hypothetical protein K456DRAFT_1472126 [Colletotrichum gloeosporioides 23]|nr:hypothetical protein K456DRAFT_1472126 [Colletotrichum gloeosporioides 23]